MIHIYKDLRNIIYIRWLYFKKTTFRQSNLTNIIFKAVDFAYYLIVSILLGVYIEDIIEIAFQSSNPLYVIQKYLPYVIVLSSLLRLIFKINKKIDLSNLLHYPISKKILISNVIVEQLFNKYTLSFILFLGAFTVQISTSFDSYTHLINFLTTQIYIIIYIELFSIIFQRGQEKNMCLYVFLIANTFLTMPIIQANLSVGVVLSLSLIVINIILAFLLLRNTLFLDFQKSTKKQVYSTKLYQNADINIIIKSIFRNKVYRRFLSIYTVLILGGGIYYSLVTSDLELSLFQLFLMIIVCSGALAGNMIVTYLFSWDSNWRGYIFSKPVTMYNYVRNRILFAESLTIIPSVWFVTLYILYDNKIVLYIGSFCLFSIVLNIVQVYYSLYYYSSEDPNILAVGSQQPARFFLFPLLGIPYLIYFLFNDNTIDANELSLIPVYILSMLGIFTIIFNRLWFRLFKKNLLLNKYKILGI